MTKVRQLLGHGPRFSIGLPTARMLPYPEHLGRKFVFLIVGAAALSAFFLLYGAVEHWDILAPFRLRRFASLVIVAIATSVSTVIFHTATGNRILTPSVMGFDSLYSLMQTGLVLILGGTGYSLMSQVQQFGINVAVMVVVSVSLFWVLFGRGSYSLYLVVLVGMVAGTFFGSVSGFLQRIIDPNDFLVLQESLFASFNAVKPELLGASAVVVIIITVYVLFKHHELDILALGEPISVNLGVNFRRRIFTLLVLSCVMVAVSTALVGPVLFFGLLVANMAYHFCGTSRHAVTIPAAILIAIITLVGGQAILEHLFNQGTILSVIIDFAGGLLFIALLLKGQRT